MLVWTGAAVPGHYRPRSQRHHRSAPLVYTPAHLAERSGPPKAPWQASVSRLPSFLPTSRIRRGSLRDSIPRRRSSFWTRLIHCMMDAVYRFEGTVNQVLGDGIMALFGAPIAHEDHALRACYAALALQTGYAPMPKRCATGMVWPCNCGLGSTPARLWCGPLATTCTWTTQR